MFYPEKGFSEQNADKINREKTFSLLLLFQNYERRKMPDQSYRKNLTTDGDSEFISKFHFFQKDESAIKGLLVNSDVDSLDTCRPNALINQTSILPHGST